METSNAGGFGVNGRLGNGGTTNSNTPVDVCARAKTGVETTCPALADIAAISCSEGISPLRFN